MLFAQLQAAFDKEEQKLTCEVAADYLSYFVHVNWHFMKLQFWKQANKKDFSNKNFLNNPCASPKAVVLLEICTKI